jgi:arsenical-resistance protein 2
MTVPPICVVDSEISASSRGRGPRAAGWFADHLLERGDSTVQSLVLEGGIKGWATSGAEYVQLMDEYVPAVWEQ